VALLKVVSVGLMPKAFKGKDKIKILLWCDHHCCLCGKACGTDIEIAHIDPNGGNEIGNAIPVCYDCHSAIGKYNIAHPRGNKYRYEELKKRREQIYEQYTRHLVPPVLFACNQTRPDGTVKKLPFVGFNIQHLGDSLPVQVRVEAKIVHDGKDMGLINDAYYNGEVKWNLNPRTGVLGGVSIPPKYVESGKDLKIEIRMTVIDQFEREHRLLPQCYRYVREGDFWNLEPRSFAEWS
jgi:hypothetical protein